MISKIASYDGQNDQTHPTKKFQAKAEILTFQLSQPKALKIKLKFNRGEAVLRKQLQTRNTRSRKIIELSCIHEPEMQRYESYSEKLKV